MPILKKNGKSQSFSLTLTFDNKEQYDLFMDYLTHTKINAMRDKSEETTQSLLGYYLQEDDEAQLKATLSNRWGAESVVSKFMEVTQMMEMDYTEYMSSGYKPDANSSYLPLGRQGDATIGPDVLERMQQYRQNSTTKKAKPTMEETIKQTLSQYEAHLRQKLVNEGIIDNIQSEININTIRPGMLTTKQRKLLNRYEAISTVYNSVKDKSSLDKEDLLAVKAAVLTCQNNKPAWSERSFLQKLTDVLSLGFKPLYRSFFSKEKQFEEELQKNLPPTLG